jgi:hypothetical protein
VVEVVGIIVGVWLVRLAAARHPLLLAAIAAQAADLVTFAIAWQEGKGERNPLARLGIEASVAALSPAVEVNVAHGIATLVAALTLMVLKLALVGYLVRIDSHLGRFRRPVLAAAIAAGVFGAGTNVLAYPNAALPLLVVAGFLLVAVRWPMHFRDAVAAALRLVLTGSLALGGLAALSYLPFAQAGWMCYPATCSPMLPTFIGTLAVALFAAAAISLALTMRFVARFLPRSVDHAA